MDAKRIRVQPGVFQGSGVFEEAGGDVDQEGQGLCVQPGKGFYSKTITISIYIMAISPKGHPRDLHVPDALQPLPHGRAHLQVQGQYVV